MDAVRHERNTISHIYSPSPPKQPHPHALQSITLSGCALLSDKKNKRKVFHLIKTDTTFNSTQGLVNLVE